MSLSSSTTRSVLPSPTDFGLPDKFQGWRPGQERFVLSALDDSHRIQVFVAPTGSGKSLAYVAAAILSGCRTLILTSTKALQTQLKTDFGVRIADMRGRNAYPCAYDVTGQDSCEEGACMSGFNCPFKGTAQCAYYKALLEAQRAQIVSTNYAFWMHARAERMQKAFQLLVCDEAHDLPNAVTSFLSTNFDLTSPFFSAPHPARRLGMVAKDWAEWGDSTSKALDARRLQLQGYLSQVSGERKMRREYRELTKFVQQLDLLHTLHTSDLRPEDWICYTSDDLDTLHYGPVWAAPFVERYLFAGIPRIFLTSASVNEKTVRMLGVTVDSGQAGVDQATVHEFPHTFPVQNRYVTHIPTVRLNIHSDESQLRQWVVRIDQIIRGRQDRKGVIHTVSYKRRDFLLQNSEFAHIMVTHDRLNTERVVREFKFAEAPKVLVSPAVTTGFDFPGAICEYQIIGKLPYPDTTNRITSARCKADPEYAAYVAMQELVQASGRAVRSVTDRAETFIVDDSITWFMKRYARFAPRWFREAYRTCHTIPTPPAKML